MPNKLKGVSSLFEKWAIILIIIGVVIFMVFGSMYEINKKMEIEAIDTLIPSKVSVENLTFIQNNSTDITFTIGKLVIERG